VAGISATRFYFGRRPPLLRHWRRFLFARGVLELQPDPAFVSEMRFGDFHVAILL
jgi:hypothetical protein